MSNEKVTISKKVADAIEKARKGYGDRQILEVAFDPNNSWETVGAKPLNDVDPMLLAKALVNGYEVERTPHDQLREYFEINTAWIEDPGSYEPTERQRFLGRNQGVLRTLNILGITVEGVNDFFPMEAPL